MKRRYPVLAAALALAMITQAQYAFADESDASSPSAQTATSEMIATDVDAESDTGATISQNAMNEKKVDGDTTVADVTLAQTQADATETSNQDVKSEASSQATRSEAEDSKPVAEANAASTASATTATVGFATTETAAAATITTTASSSSKRVMKTAAKTAATTAPNAVSDGVYQIVSKDNSNMVLDVAAYYLGLCGNIQVYTNNGTDNQKWFVQSQSDGSYVIQSMYSGQVLDVAGYGKSAETNVQQYTYNGTKNQRWKLMSAGSGYYYIVDGNSGLVLDAAGRARDCSNVQIYTKWGGNNQLWKFVAATVSQKIANGTYCIETALSSNQVLEVAGSSLEPCANAQMGYLSGSTSQQVAVTYLGDNMYEITSALSGQALDVAGCGKSETTNVQFFPYQGTSNQKWIFQSAGSGYYYLIAANSGLVLDITGYSKSAGANLQVFGGHKTVNQKFKFVTVEDPSTTGNAATLTNGYYFIQSCLNSNMVLDVVGSESASFDVSANIQLFTNYQTNNQKFLIGRGDSAGTYTIQSANSGLAVESVGRGGNGANVEQYTAIPVHTNQSWVFYSDGQGGYFIKNLEGGYYLTSDGFAAQEGTNVYVSSYTGALNQRFKLVSTSLSADQFINAVAYQARKEYTTRSQWILPSVTIAQACLESGYGNSGLSVDAKNFYGIKGYGPSTNKTYVASTQEEYDGKYVTITDGFRVYTSLCESVSDFIDFLTVDDYYGRYKNAVNNADYKSAVQAIKDGGYATDSSYVSKVVAIIEDYELYQYDYR